MGAEDKLINELDSAKVQPTAAADKLNTMRTTGQARVDMHFSEKIYRAIGESIDYGVWICAPDGRNIYASDSFLKLVGLTQEECSDFGWGAVLHPDDAERTLSAWKECIRSEGTWDIEHRFRGVDGQWHSVLARGVPVRNEQGQIICWAGLNLDISRIKLAEEAAFSNEERLRLALDAAHLATWDWDINTDAVIWNSEHYRLLGYEPGSFSPAYHHWADRLHPDDLQATESYIRKAMETGNDYRAEFRVILPDGSERIMEALGRFEHDESGHPMRCYGAMSDITQRKQLVADLRQANETLEQRVEERTTELRRSRDEWQRTFNAIPDIVTILDLKHNVIQANKAMQDIMASHRDGCQLGKPCYQMVHGLDAPPDYCPHKRLLQDGREHSEDIFEPLLNMHLHVTVAPVFDADNKLTGSIHVARNITALKQAADAMEVLNKYHRSLIEASLDPLVTINAQGEIADVNSATEQITGYLRQELIGTDFSEYFTEPDKARQGYQLVFKAGEVRDYPLEIRHKNGHLTPVQYNASVYRGSDGNVIGVFAAARDITELKRAELEREQFFKFFTTTNDIMVIAEPNGSFLKVNPACLNLLGYSAEELTAKPFIEFVHPDDRQKTVDELTRQQQAGFSMSFENRYICKDGSFRWLSWRAVYNELDQLTYATARDISKDKQQEEALRKSEEELRLLAEAMPQIVWITRPDGWNIYFNQQWMDYTGLTQEESHGHGWNKPFHPDDQQMAWDAWQNATKNLAEYSLECRLRRADGVYKWWLVRGVPVFDDQGAVIKWFGTCTDIDEFKKAEEERLSLEKQLLHTQKLESLGILAGGIAHDFNNILMAILGNAELAKMKLPPESPLVTNLHQIEQAAMRAADLAKQMLAYSGKGKFIISKLNLTHIVEEMKPMLEVSISRKVSLKLNLATDLPSIEADSSQIQQIIMNLVINASEAIGSESGFITIRTGSMECTASYLAQLAVNENMTAGDYVFLEITDTGSGMIKETQSRIFDPFFTTKFTGRGLGMAAVHGIIRGHRGGISLYSEPGKGTTFKVLLPAIETAVGLMETGCSDETWRGTGAVLLVDDEEVVREISSDMLKELGFSVIVAKDGVEALEIYKSGIDISCVILDLTMPRMDGEQCFRELRQIDPAIKIVMSSGYNEQEIAKKFENLGVNSFIQKPYNFNKLKIALKSVL